MRYALNVPNFGTLADPRVLAGLAHQAETAGWDGFFIWDHIRPGRLPLADPWVLLTSMALVTSRIKLGTMVTPLPRRKPEELARQTVTLDHLSNGRLILGVGLGDDSMREYSAFDGPVDGRVRAGMLDEGLEVLTGLWSAKPFSFDGSHYRVKEALFLPPPLQTPRIPIWVAGRWPAQRPFRRAARWNGAVPVSQDGALTPQQCREVVDFTLRHREIADPFDVAVTSWSAKVPDNREHSLAMEFEAAGATWYQVALSATSTVEDASERIRRGPPA